MESCATATTGVPGTMHAAVSHLAHRPVALRQTRPVVVGEKKLTAAKFSTPNWNLFAIVILSVSAHWA